MTTTHAPPPSAAQASSLSQEDQAIAMGQAMERIRELEGLIQAQRRQIDAMSNINVELTRGLERAQGETRAIRLAGAAVIVSAGYYQADARWIMVDRAALDEFARVSSTAAEPATEPVEETQPHIPHPWLGICSRCGTALNNISPGFSIVAGGAKVCTPCLQPGEEIARAKSLVVPAGEAGRGYE